MRPIITLLTLAVLVSCATRPGATLERFEFTRVEMGMPFGIVLYAANTNQAAIAATAAFDRVRALNAVFSD